MRMGRRQGACNIFHIKKGLERKEKIKFYLFAMEKKEDE
jgi:hypothetical protein